jgi:hypothetical protein
MRDIKEVSKCVVFSTISCGSAEDGLRNCAWERLPHLLLAFAICRFCLVHCPSGRQFCIRRPYTHDLLLAHMFVYYIRARSQGHWLHCSHLDLLYALFSRSSHCRRLMSPRPTRRERSKRERGNFNGR